VDLAVLQLESMIFKVFSNLNDSIILPSILPAASPSLLKQCGTTGSRFEAETRCGIRFVRLLHSDQGLGTRQGRSNLAGAGCYFSCALSVHR